MRAIAVVTLILVWGSTSPVQHARAASTKTPWQNLSPSKLTAVWWQWLFSVPASESPVYDETGAHAYNGQPYTGLLFLAGTFTTTSSGDDVLGEVTRAITVKEGTALFFPVLNSEIDNVCGKPRLGGNCFGLDPFPNVFGVPALRPFAAASIDTATGLFATLTPTDATFQHVGSTQHLEIQRLQSPPFSFKLPATDNLYQSFGVDVTGTVAPAVADGYYSLVAGTLAPGHYLLEFGGVLTLNDQGATFTEIITYQITVTN
jgi:hypothetical protein